MRRSQKQAREFIRACVERAEQGDDTTLDIRTHFRVQMRARCLFWADVVAILLDPAGLQLRGLDHEGRQQVWLFGNATDGGLIRIVCSIDWDTRLITLNWE
jgi:hypothetical protein